MSRNPTDLRYTPTHEWVRNEGENLYTIGITEHAAHLLGDMVYVGLPDVDDELSQGDECGVVESVKAASDIYSPLTGTVVAINTELADNPELLNEDSYIGGWLYQINADDASELDGLLDADGYTELADNES